MSFELIPLGPLNPPSAVAGNDTETSVVAMVFGCARPTAVQLSPFNGPGDDEEHYIPDSGCSV